MRRRQHFGRYKVLAEVGRGGMGVVYKARDPLIGRVVAIKTMADAGHAEKEFLTRFVREGQAAGRLQHPNIVTVYDVGEEGTEPFIAMEFVEGETLEDRLRKAGPLPWPEAVTIAADVADALAYAHAHGIVHRDIKPANIMLTPEGQAKVMDFGVARMATSNVTHGTSAIGTPPYMAPEQLQGRPADARTDLFALGVVLYEILSGQKPFGAAELAAVVYKTVHEDPPPLGTLRRDLPAALPGLVERCLAKEPGNRPAGAPEILRELQALAALPGGARPLGESARRKIAAPPRGTPGRWRAGLSRVRALLAALPGMRARLPRPQEVAQRALRSTKHLAQAGRAGAGRLSGWRWTTPVLVGITGIALLSVLVPLLTDTVGEASRLIQQGRSHDAIALLTDLEAREGAAGQTRALLGQAYAIAGERKAALRAFRLAIQLDNRYREDRDLLAGLVDLLGHRETAGEAADLLVSIGRPAVPPLQEALKSPRYRVRWNAAKALERVAEPVDMVALYILDLEREDCPTRRRAALRLGEAKDRRAVPVLRRAKEQPASENSCMAGALDAALAKLTAR